MKFEEVLPEFRAGRMIKNVNYCFKASTVTSIPIERLLRDDWEIVETEEERTQRERLEWLERVLEKYRIQMAFVGCSMHSDAVIRAARETT